MEILNGSQMPESNGHYSQCIEHDGILYLSGQLPVNATTKQIPSSIEEQTALVFKNIEAILTVAKSAKNKVLQVRIYISDIELWDKVNLGFSHFFAEHKPVRCIIPVGPLHFGCLLEVEVKATI